MSKFPLIVAVSLATLSSAYCLLCIVAAILHLRRRNRPSEIPANLPAVSILKPLKGTDPKMYESLRSHCALDYPEYEILFGISDPADPAADLVKRAQQEFPNRQIQLLLCEKDLGSNGKVSTLAQLEAIARYQVLLVNDSDIRVPPSYLREVIAEVEQPGVGLVTCLYRGVPAQTLASKLESLGISTDFVPGVLVASIVEGGIHFGLGSTLALRKRELKTIGGFETLADYLADDYELGRRIAENSGAVALSRTVVETYLPAYGFSDFVTHQLRWMRTIRTSRPAGYAGLPFTFTLPWALMTIVLSGGALWAWPVAAVAAAVRFAAAIIAGSIILRDQNLVGLLWLVPFRDLLAPLIWIGGLFGNRIVWRGKVFRLKNGRLVS